MYAFSSADRLLFVINTIKEEIVNQVQDNSNNNGTSMAEKLDKLIEETLGKKFTDTFVLELELIITFIVSKYCVKIKLQFIFVVFESIFFIIQYLYVCRIMMYKN